MRKLTVLIVALMAITLVPAGTAATSRHERAGASDIRLDPKIHANKIVVAPRAKKTIARLRSHRNAETATPAIGTALPMLGSGDAKDTLYIKNYTLRGLGDHAEVWVASDRDKISSNLNFPDGDCRNDGIRNVVTDEQLNELIDQFDSNIYPLETNAFSFAPDTLDGSNAPLAAYTNVPANTYEGPADRVVILVDNVRDQNFYDMNNASSYTYTAGFFTSTFDFLINRQVMTVDAFDWLHRTGPNPPDDPAPGDTCHDAPARPFLYEGVFAHEYQHLLENYADPDEGLWINEGLSDHAGAITGYFDALPSIDQTGFDESIQCFLGWLNLVTPANPNPDEGGPENSLTLWGDQTDFESEVLCDYGAAFSFMQYLHGQFGDAFMKALHLDPLDGLDSLADLLNTEGNGLKPKDLIERWATMVAIDGALDAGYTLTGGDVSDFTAPTLDASINWDNDQAFAGPGVPPNGSDYVRLRVGGGDHLGADAIDSVEFNGASKLPKLPIEWKVDKSPPKGSNKALFSGKRDNLDRSIVQKVKVGKGKLAVDLAWDTEEGYDYAYVQVSTDGGRSYKSVHCADSINAPLGPGFDANSHGFMSEKCNLKKYSGKTVYLGFRYVTDGGVALPGFWVDDVTLDGKRISDGTTLQGWKSPTQAHPVPAKDWFVRLVAIDDTTHQVRIGEIPLDGDFDGSSSGSDLDAIIGTTGATVSAIVTFLDRSEEVLQTAPYTLTVNGVVQPGGGA